MQTNPTELVDCYTLMMIEKGRGAVIISIDLFNYLMKKLYRIDKKDLLEKLYDCGLWYGKYLAIKSQSENWLQIFEKLMKKYAWNISDFSLAAQGENLSLKCVSPYFTAESTEAFLKFLEGAIHSGNYKTIKNECVKGMILLDFKKHDKQLIGEPLI